MAGRDTVTARSSFDPCRVGKQPAATPPGVAAALFPQDRSPEDNVWWFDQADLIENDVSMQQGLSWLVVTTVGVVTWMEDETNRLYVRLPPGMPVPTISIWEKAHG